MRPAAVHGTPAGRKGDRFTPTVCDVWDYSVKTVDTQKRVLLLSNNTFISEINKPSHSLSNFFPVWGLKFRHWGTFLNLPLATRSRRERQPETAAVQAPSALPWPSHQNQVGTCTAASLAAGARLVLTEQIVRPHQKEKRVILVTEWGGRS